ncbi:MAG TPA: type II toxin-antitoxin system RelE/ParE family toxin [Xanthobacteraceae bacterium]|nr:type II toxin-antitoxin system RelE/ParE family toxin [Xanthobacteraceae bacterium]
MDVTFKSPSLDRLETDASYSAGFEDAVVKGFRKAMQHIRAASDERTLYSRRGFRFEKLRGDREGQYSMRLNDQWRLILELHEQGTKKQGQPPPKKTVHIVEIVDYH